MGWMKYATPDIVKQRRECLDLTESGFTHVYGEQRPLASVKTASRVNLFGSSIIEIITA